jgi:hypothetical protein
MQAHRRKTELSRRRVLSLMAGSACCGTHDGRVQAAAQTNPVHIHKTAQTASGLAPATSVFDKHQMDTIAALSEIIIPTDAHSPGAKTAGVDQIISQILAASTEPKKKLWLDGLGAIDKMAKLKCGNSFADCSAKQQLNLVKKISRNEEHPVTLEERFFVAVKQSTVDAYYLSDIGIHRELLYQGNAVLTEFPGCNHEEHKGKRKEE